MSDGASKTAEAKATAVAPTEPKFTRERLIAEAHDFLGASPHVVAGALAGEPKSKKEFTISEVKSKVEKWLKAPVATSREG